MTQSRIGTLQAVKTILEEMNYKGVEHPYDHYAILSELEEMMEELNKDLIREQKYNVKFRVKSLFGTVGIYLYKKGGEVLAGDNFRSYYPEEDNYRLTEQEIREFQNGDILFEHFAVKVKE